MQQKHTLFSRLTQKQIRKKSQVIQFVNIEV